MFLRFDLCMQEYSDQSLCVFVGMTECFQNFFDIRLTAEEDGCGAQGRQ